MAAFRSARCKSLAGSCLGGTAAGWDAPPNRLRPRASRVTGVRQARRPMRKMDRSPRRKPPHGCRRAGSQPECGPGPTPISRPISGPRPVPISQPGAGTTACPGRRARSGLRTAPAACLSAWTEPIQWLQRLPGSSARSSANRAPLRPSHLTKGMLLAIRTSEPLDSKKVKPGDYFQGTVAQSVYVGNVLAIPRGAQVTGRVVDVKKPGELKGGASIALQLTTLNLGGNSYSLATDVFDTSSPGKGGYTAGNTVGATALGAAIGAIAGGGPGAAIGAVAGAGVGLGASAATPGPRSVVPPESVLTFHLTTPATVQPVSYQEANQLEASSAPPSTPLSGTTRTLRLWTATGRVRAAAPRLRALSLRLPCRRLSVPVCLRLPASLRVRLSQYYRRWR